MTAVFFSLPEYSTGLVITGRARWVVVIIPAADVVVMILVGWLFHSGSSVQDGGKCLLVLNEGFKLNHRFLKVVEEMLPLLEMEGLVTGR